MSADLSADLTAARVYVQEARSRRLSPHPDQRRFALVLLSWAASARMRHIAGRHSAPVQGELFQ